jgi:hypothetical protein
VKIPVPMLGKNIWSLRTFGSKGEEVLRVLKHNLPEEHKNTAIAFEKVIFEHHRPWLKEVIKLRDRANHYLEGGISTNAFSVYREGDEIKVPMFTNDQTVAQLMEIFWQNLFVFVEDFVALSLTFRLDTQLALLFRGRPTFETSESPWKVTTKAMRDSVIKNPGWQKLE